MWQSGFKAKAAGKIQGHRGFESLRTRAATIWQTGFLLECNANRRWGKRVCTAACAVLYSFRFLDQLSNRISG